MIDIKHIEYAYTQAIEAYNVAGKLLKAVTKKEGTEISNKFAVTAQKNPLFAKIMKIINKLSTHADVPTDEQQKYKDAVGYAINYVLMKSSVKLAKGETLSKRQLERVMSYKKIKDVFIDSKELKQAVIKLLLDTAKDISESSNDLGNYLIEQLDDILS